MEDELKYIFSNVINWLRFAEEKNAALIALNGGILFATISLISKNTNIISFISADNLYSKLALFYSYNFILFVISGLLIALLSFLPQTKVIGKFVSDSPKDDDNLLFYSHIMRYDAKKYLSKLSDSHNQESKTYSKSELDYADQIVINSCIATYKYLHFRVALWFTISAILSPVMGYILFFILDSTNKKIKLSILLMYSIVFAILSLMR